MKKEFLLLSVSLFCSGSCLAETPVNSLTAAFEAGDDGLVGNAVAEADGVSYSTTGTWEYSAIGLEPSQQITVSADEFKNICALTVIVENEWSYLSPEKAALTIVSAKGEGIESLQDLNCNLTSNFTEYNNVELDAKTGICRFDFGSGVRLSEVTFTSNIYVGVSEMKMILDVTPLVPSEPVKIYADDVVPFQKQSNNVNYRYFVSNDTDNIIDDPEELDDKLEPVPDEGITLNGKPDGDYMVYVTGPENFTPAIRHMKVSYVSEPPTSAIAPQSADATTSSTYDLLGRRISHSTRGLQIRRTASKSTLILLR